MIVKCMRPQNPNFSEEKMGLISAKKSIKTMVPYNGHALVEGSVLVGRTFTNIPVLKKNGFFIIFRVQITKKLSLFEINVAYCGAFSCASHKKFTDI